jgi:hypothetical protein
MGVELARQVQHRIGGIEVLRSLCPVGEAGDGDFAEDRPEVTGMAALDGVVAGTLGVGHRLGAYLARRTHVEVVLEELAAELPPGEFETALEVLVGETGGLAAAQEADEPLVEGMRGREGVGVLAQGRDLRLLMSALSPEFPSVSRRVRARR